MSVMFLLLPLSLLFALGAVIVFLYATKHGQFDDLETPAMRILHDDDGKNESSGCAERARDAGTRTPPSASVARSRDAR
jgi:cbb3-type cytochrome oxidase maturation protein